MSANFAVFSLLGLGLVAASKLLSYIQEKDVSTREKPSIRNAVAEKPVALSPFGTQASLDFAARLRRVCESLQMPIAHSVSQHRADEQMIRRILSTRDHTYQRKDSNVEQIISLLSLVQSQISAIREHVPSGTPLCCVELGAGKALLARVLWEAYAGTMRVLAVDVRRLSDKKARMKVNYDISDDEKLKMQMAGTRIEQDYVRIVADIAKLDCRNNVHMQDAEIVGVTKHLCGSATDIAIKALCSNVSSAGHPGVVAVCLAPCCHQKAQLKQYCNPEFLIERGFGGKIAWRTLTSLIQLSRHTTIGEQEYRKWTILKLLPFGEVRELGRCARRLLEEGRLQYLREHGFNVRLVAYVSEDVTPDNLAIVGTRDTQQSAESAF